MASLEQQSQPQLTTTLSEQDEQRAVTSRKKPNMGSMGHAKKIQENGEPESGIKIMRLSEAWAKQVAEAGTERGAISKMRASNAEGDSSEHVGRCG